MDIIKRVYDASDSIFIWFRDNAVIITFLIGQSVAGIIWGADLTSRVSIIERRGSPEVANIDRRLANAEYWIASHERVGANLQNAGRITALEKSIAIIQEHDNVMLQALKDNAAMLAKLNELLNRHMIDGKPQR